jgi:hypothetical protein
MNNWFVDIGFVPFTRSGYEVRNHNKPGESYWFETREWAQFCADHFNRLDKIKYELPINGVKLSCIKPLVYQKNSNWTCKINDNLHYIPVEGQEPNAFHRKMQELAFGIKWVKNE